MFAEDVVTEWGHVLVEDGKVIDRQTVVVDWTGRTTPPDWWVARRLQQVSYGMSMAGKTCHMSYDRMKAEGMKPEKAFTFIAQFTDIVRRKGIPFVLHNGFFDEKMLSANFLQFKFGNGFSFGDRLIDTEGVEKATQIPDNSRVHPLRNDTLRSYFTRVKHTRVQGLKSNMDEHCYAKYRFGDRYGIDPKDMHSAETDAYCCHLLMKEFGKLVSDEVQESPVYPTADSKADRRATRPALPSRPAGKRVRGQRNS